MGWPLAIEKAMKVTEVNLAKLQADGFTTVGMEPVPGAQHWVYDDRATWRHVQLAAPSPVLAVPVQTCSVPANTKHTVPLALAVMVRMLQAATLLCDQLQPDERERLQWHLAVAPPPPGNHSEIIFGLYAVVPPA